MSGVQPWDFASSPVSSNIFRFSQPMTPLCGPPALVHSVLSASSANTRWCVGKHVLISVIFPVFGSYIERCRLDWSTGNSLADGWSDPLLQKSGFAGAPDRKSTRLNSSHGYISYAVFCLKKKKKQKHIRR